MSSRIPGLVTLITLRFPQTYGYGVKMHWFPHPWYVCMYVCMHVCMHACNVNVNKKEHEKVNVNEHVSVKKHEYVNVFAHL